MNLILARDVWPKYDRLAAKLMSLRKADWKPLFETWLDVIVEDNRTGVLNGLDKDGAPMAAVRYRTGIVRPVRFRTGSLMGYRVGRFKGRGPARSGMLPNNNLTTAEYRRRTGPPLAPRVSASRVITNLRRRQPKGKDGEWLVACYWHQVLDPSGRPFLHLHFDGVGRLATRDLRGVRPQGVRRCVAYLKAFALDLLGKEG
jgi:hypothetical protein